MHGGLIRDWGFEKGIFIWGLGFFFFFFQFVYGCFCGFGGGSCASLLNIC